MLRTDRQIEDEAIGWLIRLRAADEADWESFTAWLEVDPAHAAAYDRVALADEDAAQLPPAPAQAAASADAAPPALPPRGRLATRRAWLGWAAAASVALTAGLSLSLGDRSRVVETAPGERRVIALADGSRIALNGGSRLRLVPERPRYARLESGEAFFEVVHDQGRPFEVEAAGVRLVDMGTVFNVRSEARSLEVAVSEGAVIYEPGGAAVTLKPGMALRRQGAGAAEVTRVPPEAVGSWREGRLVYSGAPISTIAADLSRNLAIRVIADRRVAADPFSGVIRLDGEPREVLERSAALLGLALRRSGEDWVLTRTSAPR